MTREPAAAIPPLARQRRRALCRPTTKNRLFPQSTFLSFANSLILKIIA